MQINQLQPGTVLAGRYTIVKRIGGGGMGNVYMARDKRLADAPRAVKEMIGMFTEESQRKKAIEDFERESQLLASLDHPAIPTIFDYFVNEGCYYLVMKLISGGDLATRLKDAPKKWIDEKTVVKWGIQICDVLSYLHHRDPPIIYRDMKPANLMLDERDRIVLVDFGIARFVAPSQKNVTAIGTMGYAPPELFAGKVEPRSDLYSLGATMFHLLTGKDPQDNPLLMFDFTRNPRMCEINTELSKGIDEIVSKSVEHKPSSRFSSGDEMKKALEDHLLWLERGVISSSAPAQASKGIFCSACGHSMGVGDRFCNNCGAPNPEFTSQQVSVVLAGANGQLITLPLTKESSMFGRLDTNRGIYPDVDLTPYDREGKVSRRHAMIHQEKGQFFIEDLGSTNGTYINNTKIPAKQRQRINTGEELRFGDIIMKFFIGPVPPSVVIPTRIATGGVVNQSSVKHTIEGSAVGIAGVALKSPAPRTAESQQKNELVSTKVEFPSRVKIGEITPLRISLRALPLGTKVEKNLDHDVEFELSLDKLGGSGKSGSSRTLDAYIAAPGFEIEPEIFAKLTVPVTGFSIPSVFYLKGIQTGSTIVTIDFYQDATCVCSVNVKTEIV